MSIPLRLGERRKGECEAPGLTSWEQDDKEVNVPDFCFVSKEGSLLRIGEWVESKD